MPADAISAIPREGLPIGSGMVEGALQSLSRKTAEETGMRWSRRRPSHLTLRAELF